MKYYCISDLHIGDRSRKDDFQENEPGLIAFLCSIPDNSLILVGDILELWQCKSDKIFEAYKQLLPLLFTKTKHYVTGNHDRNIPCNKLNRYHNITVTGQLILGDTLFMHGHQFDLVNAKEKGLGFWITKMAGWLESYVDKDIDKKAEQFVMWLKKRGRFGTVDSYREKAFAYARGITANGQKIKRIIIGHTHQPDHAVVDGIEYHNCGTWTNGRKHIVELEVL